jgi:GT2 family glycosyltransferase
MLRSVTAATRQFGDGAAESTVTVAIGDCGGPEGPDVLLGEAALSEAREILTRAGILLDYVAFRRNLGHGAAQNVLAERAAGSDRTRGDRDVLVLVNPDTYLSPDCLATLVGVLDDDSVGIAEARQIPLEHPKSFDPVTGDTPWASGCLMALRASVFEALGGFEPAFFLHGDDVDLSWRVRLAGLRVLHVP